MKLKIKNLLILAVTILVPVMIIAAPMAAVKSNQVLAAAPIGDTCKEGNAKACLNNSNAEKTSKMMGMLLNGIRFLAALVFLSAVIMMIVGGIQYATANGNPQAVASAKKRIYDVLIGVIAFVFLYAFLEWLIPGGIWDTVTTP